MDKTLRAILWILVALVLLSSFSASWFFMAKERVYDEYVNLESLFRTSMERLNRELASVNKESIELKSKLEAVEKELSILESRNVDLKSQYEKALSGRDDLEKELVRVKKGKFFLEKKVKDIESDNFIAGLLKEKVTLEVELKRLKKTLTPKDLEIGRLKKDIMDFDFKLSQSEQEKDLLEQNLKDSTVVAEILSKDLLKEKDRNREDRKKTENTKIENRLLKIRVSELEEDADRFKNLFAERDNMQLKIASLERELETKEEQIDNLKLAHDRRRDSGGWRAEAYHAPDEVELPPIILQREDYGRGTVGLSSLEKAGRSSALKGRIATVNREHDFVVIDLGEQDGIHSGAAFNVYRGDLIIGSIETMQTRTGIAACDIRDVKEGFRIEIDDVVIKQ